MYSTNSNTNWSSAAAFALGVRVSSSCRRRSSSVMKTTTVTAVTTTTTTPTTTTDQTHDHDTVVSAAAGVSVRSKRTPTQQHQQQQKSKNSSNHYFFVSTLGQIQACGKTKQDASKCRAILQAYCKQQVQLQQHPLQYHHHHQVPQEKHPPKVPSSLVLAALRVCGKARDASTALDVYHTYASPSDDACRAAAISIVGRASSCPSRGLQRAMQLWQDHQDDISSTTTSTTNGTSTTSTGSCNAAIAVCGHFGAWNEAWNVFFGDCSSRMPQQGVQRSLLTCNVLLTALARSKRGVEAQQVLNQMDYKKRRTSRSIHDNSNNNNETAGELSLPLPDRTSFHNVVVAWIRQGDLDAAHQVFVRMKENTDPAIWPRKATYDALSMAYAKHKQWNKAAVLDEELWQQQQQPSKTNSIAIAASANPVFQRWNANGLTKVGRGKTAYWKLGTYNVPCRKGSPFSAAITVALQPHRNPGKNGISLILLENHMKLGYLLMVNDCHDSTDTTKTTTKTTTSRLLGVYVDPAYRKHGLSKVFLAIWMHLCLYARLAPTTGMIQKPLLALVLQHTFGFQPGDSQGVDATVSRGDTDDEIVLYSASLKSLEGAFSPRDVKREGMVFATTTSNTKNKGRMVRVGGSFVPPDNMSDLTHRIDSVLTTSTRGDCIDDAGSTRLHYHISRDDLCNALLGRRDFGGQCS